MQILLIGSGGREHALAWNWRRAGRLKKFMRRPATPALPL